MFENDPANPAPLGLFVSLHVASVITPEFEKVPVMFWVTGDPEFGVTKEVTVAENALVADTVHVPAV